MVPVTSMGGYGGICCSQFNIILHFIAKLLLADFNERTRQSLDETVYKLTLRNCATTVFI